MPSSTVSTADQTGGTVFGLGDDHLGSHERAPLRLQHASDVLVLRLIRIRLRIQRAGV